MTVSPHPKDSAGAAKQAEVVVLTAASAAASGPTKAHIDAKLDQTQKELVAHYMNIGRITAAAVLSTLS